ncbi:hypothetical protein Aduo_018231 [Ancylostoma duodenale]
MVEMLLKMCAGEGLPFFQIRAVASAGLARVVSQGTPVPQPSMPLLCSEGIIGGLGGGGGGFADVDQDLEDEEEGMEQI